MKILDIRGCQTKDAPTFSCNTVSKEMARGRGRRGGGRRRGRMEGWGGVDGGVKL